LLRMKRFIAPSILAANFNHLEKDIQIINQSEADFIHFDVMDGVFVPNISFGIPVIEHVKKIAKKIGLPQPEKYKKKDRRIRRYLTVGELATRSGLNARTIKYWEERGIIEPTTRSEGGFRLYDEQYIFLCSLIHDLQLFGYSLEAIKEIADLFRLYYDINTDNFSGSDEEKYAVLEIMIGKIGELNGKTNEIMKGIERWHKLLKEKQTDIQSQLKKLSKEQEKASMSAPAKAKSQS